MRWQEKRLKHLCVDGGQYGLNVSSDSYVDDGVRLIRTSDISGSGRLREDIDDFVYIDSSLGRRHELRAGDLLLSRSGTIGRALLVPQLTAKATFAGYLVRFRPRSKVDARFLYYVANSIPFQDAVHSSAVIATIQNFNAERYANIRVPCPPVDEQRRIADFLDSEVSRIDRLRLLRELQLNRANEREKAARDQLLDVLVEEYGELPLRRFTLGIEQGASPQCDGMAAARGEIGLLKLSSIKRGRFFGDENKRLPEGERFEQSDIVRPGDFLVTRANTPLLVGDIAVVDDLVTQTLLLPDLIYRVRLNGRLNPMFLAEVALSSRVRGVIESVARGSSQSMVKLRGEDIRAWPIPNVPQILQSQLVDELGKLRTHVDSLRIAIEQQMLFLEERKRALVTAAVTGQMDVTTARGFRE
ncbi:restriction endonuclease subunit S [Actinomadura luteofluorescens]|uniref:restriction endonuclease subunit S n=1 Tax=Actinomadura luteofluorescens TaxID=46163 RepID=UPI00349229D5